MQNMTIQMLNDLASMLQLQAALLVDDGEIREGAQLDGRARELQQLVAVSDPA